MCADMVDEGLTFHPGYLSEARQAEILRCVEKTVQRAPFYRPTMPRSGRPFSIEMTNAGILGWVSDRSGYRYQATHPETHAPWPELPEPVLAVWQELSAYPHAPECCLINRYLGGRAKLGMHRDEDEETYDAPVVSISLGDTCIFRVGGLERRGSTRSLRLASGDVLVLGGRSRLYYHGVDRILSGSSRLIEGGGRINLTLRRVTAPAR